MDFGGFLVDFGARAATVSIPKDPKGQQTYGRGRRCAIMESEAIQIWHLMLSESFPHMCVSPPPNYCKSGENKALQ